MAAIFSFCARTFVPRGIAIDAFVFEESWPLTHWSRPAAVALVYCAGCLLHNATLAGRSSASSHIVDAVAVLHNILLVVFSAVVFLNVAYHFGLLLSDIGLHRFLCAPPTAATAGAPAALGGALHLWCYIFYLSKYYELVDTLLLVLRAKRVIVLHAVHHALIPLTMCLLFDGRVSVSLVSLSLVNSFVHIVMYGYYLACACGRTPLVWWKRRITELQIMQFTAGVLGGGYYWLMYFQDVRFQSVWPYVQYIPGCAGGEPLIVLVGYVMNSTLLFLFARFYRSAYLRPRAGNTKRKQL